MDPVGRAEEEGDPNAGYFVDDDKLGVFAARLAGNYGGGGDAEGEGEGDPDEEADEGGTGAGMAEVGLSRPEKERGNGAPGAGAGFAIADAEEGGCGPGPLGFLVCGRRGATSWGSRVWRIAGFGVSRHSCRRCGGGRDRRGPRGLRDRGWGS